MANAKRCDRCGGFYVDSEKKFEWATYTVDRINIMTMSGGVIGSYDLCDECLEKPI